MTFDELYERHADAVFSYLRFKLRDIHLAEDIFQDTFLAAYRQMAEGTQPERPKAWLLTIAHRRLVDRLRRLPAGEAPLDESIARVGGDNRLEWTDAVALDDMLSRLDEASRTILYSLYVEGMTVREVAEMLGIPEGTVKSRCHSAKQKLSDWMKEGAANG